MIRGNGLRSFSFAATALLAGVWCALGFESIPEDDLGQQTVIQARTVAWASDIPTIPREVMVYKVVPRPVSFSILSDLALKYNFPTRCDPLPTAFGPGDANTVTFSDEHRQRYLSYHADLGAFSMLLTNGMGYTYDAERKQPIFGELVSEQEAVRRSVDMLSSVGLSTNDLYVSPDTGQPFYKPTGRFLGYTDKPTHQRKRVQIEREIWFFRQIDGCKVYGFGGGGGVKFRFLYQTLAEVEWLLRGSEPFKKMPIIGKDKIFDAVRKNKCYGWSGAVSCDKAVIKKVDLQYYEGNHFGRQHYFIPVFAITCALEGATDNRKEIELLLPALR
jgi:hypothetical protein